MVKFTIRFLHLFLVLVAIGVFDLSTFSINAAPLTARSSNSLARLGIVLKSDNTTRRSTSSAFDGFEIRAQDMAIRSLPLTKFDQRNQQGHPLMLLQHHINRANLKLAKMKGRELPSDQDLHLAMERRKRDILDSEAVKRSSNRFSYITTSSNRFSSNRGRIGVVLSEDAINVASTRKRHLEGHNILSPKARSTKHTTTTSSKKSTSTKKATSTSTKKATSTTKKTTSTTKKSTSTSSTSSKATSTSNTVDAVSKAENANGFPKAALEAADSNTVEAAKTVTAEDSLGLAIEANDVGYIATVQIGSSNTNFRMLIDSGSADTWVPSSACTGCGSSHQKLGKSISSTYVKSSTSFSITYGTGSASGHLGYDSLKIAGLTLKNHSMAIITKESSDFSDNSVPFDGLMGLAKKTLSNSGKPTPIDSLYAASLVPATVMGYHLARAVDEDNDGEVTFGGVDKTKYSGSLTEITNVSDEGFFEIPIEGVSFAGTAISGISSASTAILDTGTTLMVAPSSAAELIHAQIPGSASDGNGGYTIPCNTTSQLSFTFGGVSWPLNSEDMLFLPVNDNDLNGDCISALSGGSVGSANEWLLGASFLKNVYFATNAKANVIGLGALA